MNTVVPFRRDIVALNDVKWVSHIALKQLADAPDGLNWSVSDLLLNEPFALGYVVGFAEHACWHLCKGNGEADCRDYLRTVIACMLGNEAAAESFLSFAVSKKGDRVFEGGYDEGMRDLDDLYLSRGSELPLRLRVFLKTKHTKD